MQRKSALTRRSKTVPNIKIATPTLRFPLFQNDWERKKISELVHSIESGVSVNSEDRIKNNSELGILKTSAVSKGKFFPLEHKTILEHEKIRAKLNPQKGSIIISRMNTPQLVGQSGYVAKTYEDLFIPDRLWLLTTNNSVDSKWLSYVLASDRMVNAITSTASGTSNSMKNISQSSFLGLGITIPELAEQKEIANFLTATDEKIDITEKKINLLKKYKLGIVQKLLKQEIRFKNERGNNFPEWVDKKLSDVLNPGSKEPVKNTLEHRKITIKLHKKGINFTKSGRVMADTRPFYLRSSGELIIGKQNYFNGSIAIVDSTHDKTICSNAIMSFRAHDNCSVDFIYEYISTASFLMTRQSLANGTGQKELSEKNFLKFDISMPVKDEQDKITGFIKSVEEKIVLEESKIKALNVFKKTLLRKMLA